MEIHTVDDLIRILQEHPEWRDRLRDALFTEEEKQIPDRLRRVEEALERLTESHERAVSRLERLEASVEKLWESHQQALERLDRLEASVEKLWESHQQLLQEVRELRVAVDRLTSWLEKLDTEVGKWRGYTLELRFHHRASAILGYYVRRPRVVDLGLFVEDLMDSGVQFTDTERQEVLRIDELVSAKHPQTGEPIHIAVEVSWMIFPEDVERISRRAAILTEHGVKTFPVVAGEGITPDAKDLAQREKVLVILDGTMDTSGYSWVR